MDELDADEIAAGSEILAPCLSELMKKADPNSPWGTASLWLFLTYGPRALDVRAARQLRRRQLAASSAPAEPAEAEAPPAAASPPPGVHELRPRGLPALYTEAEDAA